MINQTATGRITVLWNVKSGWEAGEEQARAVEKILGKISEDVEIRQVRGSDIRQLAEDSIRDGSTTLIAAGGDGTVNAVASVAARHSQSGKRILFGVIPAGTLNHFARDLGIELDPETAARQIETGRELAVDLGSVNDHIFINNSGLGLYPVYRAARRALEFRGLGHSAVGRFATVVGGILQVIWRLPHLQLRFTARGRAIEMTTAFVLVANNEHDLEKERIGKRNSLSSGRLWVYVLKPSSRWRLLSYLVRYMFGRFVRTEAFEEFCVSEIQISPRRRKRIGVSLDGEILHLATPLHFRSLPGALQVIAPADSPIS